MVNSRQSRVIIVALIVIIVALLIVGGLLSASLIDNAKYQELLVAEQEKNTCLEGQISLHESQATLYESQIAQSEMQILQLQGEVEFYKEEVLYWQSETVYRLDWQGGKLREFGSVEELEQWLADDPISERKWVYDLYDCDDFAIDLVLSALSDLYWIGLGVTDTHMFCFTIIGNDIYKIEATSDRVEPWGVLD
ncbi:hypothetical protein ES703_124448 [subsurface metagenome]